MNHRLLSSGWDFVRFDSNRPIGIRDRIFRGKSIRIELDFVLQVLVRSDPIGQSSNQVFPPNLYFPLFLQVVPLFPATSVYFPQLFPPRHQFCLPRQFIYRHLNVPLFPSTRGSKWLIGYPIGRSDSARKRVSNRSSDWTVRLVTDPIDQSKNSVQCDSMRSSGRTKSPIGRINSSIEHMGLTLIRSDPSIGPTKSQPKTCSTKSCSTRIDF